MALWSMKCTSCGWEGDRVCRYDDLDKQTCGVEISNPHNPDGEKPDPDKPKPKCEGKLVRTEEIETAHATKYAWKP